MSLLATIGDAARGVETAHDDDKAVVYGELGMTVTFDPLARTLVAECDIDTAACGKCSCRRGDLKRRHRGMFLDGPPSCALLFAEGAAKPAEPSSLPPWCEPKRTAHRYIDVEPRSCDASTQIKNAFPSIVLSLREARGGGDDDLPG